MPSDFQLKCMNAFHRGLQKASFGKLGWKFGEMPVVELTTVGRKSGEPRSVMLTSPVQEDGAYVVVASRGGDAHHPAWYLNLRDNPDVEVAIGGGKREARTARIATSEERERMWPTVTKVYKGYAGYQTKTDREIPLVYLDPKS
jgi:deazaflavin-dependent oxidoreductase (nitroreductase family)